MSIEDPQRRRAVGADPLTSAARARALAVAEFTARGKAFRFPKGQSGNPDGQSRFYHECRKIAREASPEMMRGLVDLARTAEDERVRSVCLIAVMDRAGVRPIDYNPAEDTTARKPNFDPGLYTPEQLAQIEATLRMIAATQAEAEDGL